MMGEGIVIYDGNGEESLSSTGSVLLVSDIRTTKSKLITPPTRYYFYDGDEEVNSTVLVRPRTVGNTLYISTSFGWNNPYSFISSSGASGSNFDVEVAITKVGTPTDNSGYLDVYDENGVFKWSAASFSKAVRIVYHKLYSRVTSNAWIDIPIPTYVDTNNLFILPDYSKLLNDDDGTEDVAFSGIHYKVEGRVAKVRISSYGDMASYAENFRITLLEVVR